MGNRVTPHGVHVLRRLLDSIGLSRAIARSSGEGSSPASPDEHASGPIVSVIIPIYNVEAYLKDCLDSVVNQEFTDFEAIVVDDGSPDASAEIAREYAERDLRVRLVSRPNGGLGAARNTGIRHASGEYLTFLDSDDELPRGALRMLVESAQDSGSDMVVGSLRRFNSIDTWKPSWVDELHSAPRKAITIGDHPALVRNNYTVCKLYRRDFWDDAGLWFREGVAYEDQPLVTQLYVRARSIDVIPESVYRYRARDDKSSISQQTATIGDLRDRIEAWRVSADEFSQNAPEPIYRAWQRTLLDAHFHWYLRSPAIVDDEYWSELQQAIDAFTADVPRQVWESVPPDRRVVVELARQKRREDIIDFYAHDGARMTAHPAAPYGDGVRCLLPFADDPGLPDWLFAMTHDELVLEHEIDGFQWLDGLRARISGWAYVRQVDLGEHSTRVDVVVRHDESDAEIVFGTEMDTAPSYPPPVEHDRIDYSAGAFATTVDLRPCIDQCLREGGRWRAYLRVTTGSITAEIPVRRLIRSSSAGIVPAAVHPDGHRVIVDWRLGEPLEFEVAAHRVEAIDVRLVGNKLRGALRGPAVPDITAIEFTDGEGNAITVAEPGGMDGQNATFALRLPEADLSGLRANEVVAWHVRATLRSGELVRVAYLADHQFVVFDTVNGAYAIERTRNKELTICAWRMVAFADSATVDADGILHVEGSINGVRADESLQLRLRNPKTQVYSERFTRREDGRFSVSMPLEYTCGRFGPHPLPMGAHDAAIFVGEVADDLERVPVMLKEGVGTRLPVPVSTDRLEGRIIRGPENRLRIHLSRPLGAARGRHQQTRLRNSEPASELRRALLVRSYFGESATCNGVGIVRELRRRGADLDVFWSVRDYSVPVPEGARPVVVRSALWYELLGSASYYLDNMFQPTFHRKPPGQVLIQTFHGYPFKTMGRAHWEQTGLSQQAIDAYARRAAEWDYLVSPASYATPLLQRDFAYDGEVLEIGYPRNDALFADDTDKIRAVVRESLGIEPDQRAVLYAPTFRDYESPDDHRAALVDLLDIRAVADALGDDGVLLVRGHAFNARAGVQVGTHPGVIDVTQYPEVSDLFLAADVAVVDYSSLRFDFAVTGKPMIFHVPDLERYEQTRGWVVDFESTAPGPHVSTTDDVIARLRDLGGVTDAYGEAYERFRRNFLELEDGRASERFVDAVMVPRGDAPAS